MAFRRWSVALGVLSVLVGVACLVGAVLVLRGHETATEQLLKARQAENVTRWAVYEDEMRRLMKKLGFNLMILHEDQRLSNPDAETKYLPESYVQKLTGVDLMLINHVLPFLEQKVWWPEQKRWVTLVGTRGEVFVKQKWQKRLVERVSGGKIILGYELHRSLGLKKGDTVKLLQRDFRVHACLAPNGFAEDEKMWMDLDQAQELLHKEDKITGILALQCNCSGSDATTLRKRLLEILPGTQVREHRSHLLTRAEARRREAQKAEREIAELAKTQADLQAQRRRTAGVLAPLVILACVLWLAFLSWGNARQRRQEIAILRAIGLRAGHILLLFLGKAGLIGLAGAILGCAAGIGTAAVWAAAEPGIVRPPLDPSLLLACVALAPLLSMLAAWLPALAASAADPVAILSEE